MQKDDKNENLLTRSHFNVKLCLVKVMKNNIEEKKIEKEKTLLNAAFDLFTQKDIKCTSIQDIVDKAGVAKGTFYLYFKDKYEIRDTLIAKKSKRLFIEALDSVRKENLVTFSDEIIYIIDHVVNQLNNDKLLLKFISKNLSWGIYNKNVMKLTDKDNHSLLDVFLNRANEKKVKLKNPEITLFMIIELVGSTCFTSILYQEPVSIEIYKPYLYDTIRNMLNN